MENIEAWQQRRSQQSIEEQKPFNSSQKDSQAQRDRARIIHSASFRRLQSKTQVLAVGEGDFYRTRLTHSLEVAQIGSGIVASLSEKYAQNHSYLFWLPTQNQIESICLCHDIGHPPFGHGGEIALNYFMYKHGGFEGNGHTLRIASKLGEYADGFGLDLTRRTLLGLLKYPAPHNKVAAYTALENATELNIDPFKPPKCIHDDEQDVLDWVLAPISEAEKQLFRMVQSVSSKHGKTVHKAFDTSIMELADDIAYGVHDLEDALALGLVTERQWNEQVIAHLNEYDYISKRLQFFNDHLFSTSNRKRKHAISKLVGYLVGQIEIMEKKAFETPLLRYQAIITTEAEHILKLLKNFVYNNVINRPEVRTIEYKGQQIIVKLFDVLQANPKLLPKSTLQKFYELQGAPRVICDYISGMTDHYAIKLYQKMFSPAEGSVFDRI